MIRRSYECMDCQALFEVDHESGEEGFPPCPNCERVLEWRPKGFAIGGSNEGKAVNMAQQVMEQDFGLSNFRDNNREGDVGYIDPTRKTVAEKDAIMQRESEAGREVVKRLSEITEVAPQNKPMVDGFFGGQAVQIGQNRIDAKTMIAAGKSGPGVTDPMAMFHKGIKSGAIPKVQNRILARADMSGKIVK